MRLVTWVFTFRSRWEILLLVTPLQNVKDDTRLRLTSQRLKFKGNRDLNPLQRSENGFTTLTPS